MNTLNSSRMAVGYKGVVIGSLQSRYDYVVTKRRKNANFGCNRCTSIGNLLKEIAMGYMVIVGQDI